MNRIVRILALACAMACFAAGAQAHAFLKTAEPAVGSVVTVSPRQLRLHYTEGVEVHFSGVTVAKSNGKPIAGTKLAIDPTNSTTLILTLPYALAPATYKVSWHVVAEDTHKTEGDYSFEVAPTPHAAAGSAIEVSSPWARATVGDLGTGIVYLTIANQGKTDDSLIAAATPVASQVELHQSVNDNDVMKMPAVSGIAVKAGGTTTLAPDGFHIMLIGLKAPLKQGDSFPITLTFAKAGKVEANVQVLGAAALGPTPPSTGSTSGMKM